MEEKKKKRELDAEEAFGLVRLAAQMCEMVCLCAPMFGAGSQGEQLVKTAREVQPRLAEMLTSLAKEKGKEQEK